MKNSPEDKTRYKRFPFTIDVRNGSIRTLKDPVGAFLSVKLEDWEQKSCIVEGVVIDANPNYLQVQNQEGGIDLIYTKPTHTILEVRSAQAELPYYKEYTFKPYHFRKDRQKKLEDLQDIESENNFVLCSVSISDTNTTLHIPGKLAIEEIKGEVSIRITNSRGSVATIDPTIFPIDLYSFEYEDKAVQKNLQPLERQESLRLYDYNKKEREELVNSWYQAITHVGESPFALQETYQYLENNVDDVLLLLKRNEQNTAGKDSLEEKLAPLIELDERLLVCLFHPAVYSRTDEFIDFVTQPDAATNLDQLIPFRVLQIFLEKLRKELSHKYPKLYRGLVLTESEARNIAERGMVSAGMLNEEAARRHLHTLLAPYDGCVEGKFPRSFPEEISRKLDDIPIDNKSMVLSLSEHEEIAASAGYHDSGRNDQDASLYMTTIIDMDPIQIIEYSKLFGEISAQVKAVLVGAHRYSGDAVELFVPFVIPPNSLEIKKHHEQNPLKYSFS